MDVPSELPGMYSGKNPANLMFNKFARDVADMNQWKIAFFASLVVIGILAYAIKEIYPLKTVKIYRLEVDKLDKYAVVPLQNVDFKPSDNEVRARFKELITNMHVITDRKLTKANLGKAEAFFSGQAIRQFNDFLVNERIFARLVDKPDLVREVKINSVKPIESGVMFADFSTFERIGASDRIEKRYSMTLRYEIKPATTDEEVLGPNPAGIYVVSFTISELN